MRCFCRCELNCSWHSRALAGQRRIVRLPSATQHHPARHFGFRLWLVVRCHSGARSAVNWHGRVNNGLGHCFRHRLWHRNSHRSRSGVLGDTDARGDDGGRRGGGLPARSLPALLGRPPALVVIGASAALNVLRGWHGFQVHNLDVVRLRFVDGGRLVRSLQSQGRGNGRKTGWRRRGARVANLGRVGRVRKGN